MRKNFNLAPLAALALAALTPPSANAQATTVEGTFGTWSLYENATGKSALNSVIP